jgi:ABC-type multidrug transport system ATPase subunit
MKLTVKDIYYNRKEKNILNGIRFQVDTGQVTAVLGHNGAGKSSLFEIVTDVIKPTSGTVLFNDNQSFAKIKHQVGVLWDNIALFPLLKVKEIIRYISSIYGIRQLPVERYSFLELEAIENSMMCKLSKGEQKRVELFIATLHSPDLLILDEPTAALDPIVRGNIWDKVILNEGRTVLFSTHLWDEAFQYADTIIFLHHGRQLNHPASGKELIESSRFKRKIVLNKSICIEVPPVFSYETESNKNFLFREEDADTMQKIKAQTMSYSVMPVTMEDIYHYLIQKQQ